MIYLDNGATSFPKPPGMIAAMNNCMSSYCGNPGRSGHAMSMRTGEEVYKTRIALADLFQIGEPERIIFTSNATEALNTAIKGVLSTGDHVVTTAMEHNSVLRPLKVLESSGVTHSIVKCRSDGTLTVEAIRDAIRANTKMIICTFASNVTGTIMPIARIGQLARQKNILFLVDAAQGAGCVPIDVNEMKIDMLAVPGHKGLLGPLGTGALFVRQGISIWPLKEGGTGTESKNTRQPWEFPEGYEAGTLNAPGIIGLGASIGYLKKIGVENIRLYEESLLQPLQESLQNMNRVTLYGPEKLMHKAAVATFNVEGKGCEEVAQILSEKYNIAARAGFHCAPFAHMTIGTWECGAVRLSMGPFNTKKEVKAAIEAIYWISTS